MSGPSSETCSATATITPDEVWVCQLHIGHDGPHAGGDRWITELSAVEIPDLGDGFEGTYGSLPYIQHFIWFGQDEVDPVGQNETDSREADE